MQANLVASQWPTLRLVFTLLAASGYICTAGADSVNDNLTFDVDILRQRGIDPKLAEIFRHRPRFLPGESSAVLTVNGTTRGRVKVRFDEAGTLCADRPFQRQAGLILPLITLTTLPALTFVVPGLRLKFTPNRVKENQPGGSAPGGQSGRQ